VIHNILSSSFANLTTPENYFLSKDGGGAGNNWATRLLLRRAALRGHQWRWLIERQRESDSSRFAAFSAVAPSIVTSRLAGIYAGCTSIAGGTGIRARSFLLERLTTSSPKN